MITLYAESSWHTTLYILARHIPLYALLELGGGGGVNVSFCNLKENKTVMAEMISISLSFSKKKKHFKQILSVW